MILATFALRPIAEAARARNLPVVFDADKATTLNDPLFASATHVIFSSECLRQTVGKDDLSTGVAQMARLTGKFVAVTNGPGDLVWSEGGKVSSMPVFKIVAVDTLAAGDIFHGAFVLALVQGSPITESSRFAAAAAGLKCTRFGGSPTIPTREEVESFSQVFLVSRDLGPASGYPIGTTCRVLGLSCSGYYKLPTLNAPHHLEFALNGSRSSASRPVPVLSTYTC